MDHPKKRYLSYQGSEPSQSPQNVTNRRPGPSGISVMLGPLEVAEPGVTPKQNTAPVVRGQLPVSDSEDDVELLISDSEIAFPDRICQCEGPCDCQTFVKQTDKPRWLRNRKRTKKLVVYLPQRSQIAWHPLGGNRLDLQNDKRPNSYNGIVHIKGRRHHVVPHNTRSIEPYWHFFSDLRASNRLPALQAHCCSVPLMLMMRPFIEKGRSFVVDQFRKQVAVKCLSSQPEAEMRFLFKTMQSCLFYYLGVGPVEDEMEAVLTVKLQDFTMRKCCTGETMCSFCCELIVLAGDIMLAFVTTEMGCLCPLVHYDGASGVFLVVFDKSLRMRKEHLELMQQSLDRLLQKPEESVAFACAVERAVKRSAFAVACCKVGRKTNPGKASHISIPDLLRPMRMPKTKKVALSEYIQKEIRKREPHCTQGAKGDMTSMEALKLIEMCFPPEHNFWLEVFVSLQCNIAVNTKHQCFRLPYLVSENTGNLIVTMKISCMPHVSLNNLLQVPVCGPFGLQDILSIDGAGHNEQVIYDVTQACLSRNMVLGYQGVPCPVDPDCFVDQRSLGSMYEACAVATDIKRFEALSALGVTDFGKVHMRKPQQEMATFKEQTFVRTAEKAGGEVRDMSFALHPDMSQWLTRENEEMCVEKASNCGVLMQDLMLPVGTPISKVLFELAKSKCIYPGGEQVSTINALGGAKNEPCSEYLLRLLRLTAHSRMLSCQSLKDVRNVVERMSKSEIILMLTTSLSSADFDPTVCSIIQHVLKRPVYREAFVPWPQHIVEQP
uniref:EO3 n=1 Tax=Blueface angelfish adomavirus TaxID=2609871 RepID=A0A6F9FCN7_9VIRU|nr:TPA_asm: EO3 [Blueface angelfish adomavirus]